MKYPQAGDLQRKLSTQISNPAQKNPYEVRSPSGLEGVYANEGDAEFHADELRRSGVGGVVVERRVRQRGGMARSNPSSDFGGPHPDWAESNENAVRDALARSSTEFAEVLGRFPQSVSSSDRAKYRKGDHKREFFELPDWKRVYVFTEYGIGDPVSDIDVHRAFGKAVEYLKRVTGEEWMWESINPGKQMFVMLDRERRKPPRVTRERGNPAPGLGHKYVLGSNPIKMHRNPTFVGFHGSTRPIKDPTTMPMSQGQFGVGIYFSTSEVDAGRRGFDTYRSSLHIESPFIAPAKRTPELDRVRIAFGINEEDVYDDDEGAWYGFVGLLDGMIELGLLSKNKFIPIMRKLGYDGIVVPNEVVRLSRLTVNRRAKGDYIVVFDVASIKSWDPAFATHDEWATAYRASMGEHENPARVTRERYGDDVRKVNQVGHMKNNPSSGHLMPVGASLRDELVEEIDSTDWDNVDSDGVPFADRAAKVRSLLLGATKQGKGFAIDTRSLTSKDYEFLSDNLEDGVARNMKNIASSRGVGLGQIGRQIREFRESIGRFGGVLPEENPARRARSNPPGDLTYRHFYRTGGRDCANVISIDEFDLDLGTAEQIVADATSDWDDDLERDWRSQMDDEDFEGLDPHEAFDQWKAGWRAQAVRIIADRLKERSNPSSDFGGPHPDSAESNENEEEQARDAVNAANLARDLRMLPAYNGWTVAWEYPGYLAFHRAGSCSVLATPDYHERGQIAVEVRLADGSDVAADDIAWPREDRTPEGFMALLRPVLDRADTMRASLARKGGAL